MDDNRHDVNIPDRLPVMPLRSTIVFPFGVVGVQVGMRVTLEMLARHTDDQLLVALVMPPGEPDDPVRPEDLTKIGVAARLSDRLNLPGGAVQATVQGLQRIQLLDIVDGDEGLLARVEPVSEEAVPEERARDLIAAVLAALEALAGEVERLSTEIPAILRMNVGDPSRFADLVATLANFGAVSKDEVLQRISVEERLRYILDQLEDQLRRFRHVEEADQAAEQIEEASLSPAARAAKLRQRIKRLQAELGEVDPGEREAIELLRRTEAAALPPPAAARVRMEVERLRALGPTAAEAAEIRGYIDWILHMPWTNRAAPGPASLELEAVRESFDRELLGLEEPKERLLDYVAVAKLRGDLRGPIPCLVGPPDVGKRSLVEALAAGLGRPLARLDLGGRGETQIIGLRRARPGATPGKLADAFRGIGARDPVFLLEELDLIGLGKVEGDPIEALEEALVWESRERFTDRYLDLPFDLGETLFMATAQDFYRVPRELRELLVEIRIAGYTPEEKVAIARERMLARLAADHGLETDDAEFDDEALFYLARGYARDAGLGLLRRNLATLLRTRARAKARGELGTWSFDASRMEEILGLPRYVATVAESAPEIGVVTGLAWTAAGGELMFIEALKMPGSGRLIITGMLGEVMRESVNAAYSYVRSRGTMLQIPEEAFRDYDIHVHFPVGAIPKDGPSAGIAVTLALASTLSNRPVRHDIAMSGEVTLRGKVLEIGGVKEKVLAAYRAGIREVILPRGNDRDLREVPADVRDHIDFRYVERMDEVMSLALLEPLTVDEEEDSGAARSERKTAKQRERGSGRKVARS